MRVKAVHCGPDTQGGIWVICCPQEMHVSPLTYLSSSRKDKAWKWICFSFFLIWYSYEICKIQRPSAENENTNKPFFFDLSCFKVAFGCNAWVTVVDSFGIMTLTDVLVRTLVQWLTLIRQVKLYLPHRALNLINLWKYDHSKLLLRQTNKII